MKDTTKKTYVKIAKRFSKLLPPGKIYIHNFEKAIYDLCKNINKINTLRCYKAGIRFWLVGRLKDIKDTEKKKKIRKMLEDKLDETIKSIKEQQKEKNENMRRTGYRYIKKISIKKLEKILNCNLVSEEHKKILLVMILTASRPSEIKNLQIIKTKNEIIFIKKVNKKTNIRNKRVIIRYKKSDINRLFSKYNLYNFNFNKYNEDTIRKIVQRIRERTKVDICAYSLRNFASMQFYKIFKDNKKVAEILGHEKLDNNSFYARSTNSSEIFLPRPEINVNFVVKKNTFDYNKNLNNRNLNL